MHINLNDIIMGKYKHGEYVPGRIRRVRINIDTQLIIGRMFWKLYN